MPGPLVYLNPFIAQAEVAPTEALCASNSSLRYYCNFRETFVSSQNGIIFVNRLRQLRRRDADHRQGRSRRPGGGVVEAPPGPVGRGG